MTRLIKSPALILFLAIVPSFLQAQPLVEYLGNEGVRVELGEVSVLIDALWDNDHGEYERVPPALLAELTAAKGRFEEIDYMLVSHWHGDHFAPEMVATFLAKNGDCTFISSRQVVDRLRRAPAWRPKLEERVIEVDIELGESLRVLNLKGGAIDATWVLHSHERNHEVVNLAFRVETAKGSIVHTGDAENEAASAFLSRTKSDVALVAFWQFLGSGGVKSIENSPGIKRFVAMHVPLDTSPYVRELGAIKGLVVLDEPGETFRY